MEYKIGSEARCAVIGYGSWATALVGLLAANGRRVGWYVRNPEVLESLRTEGRNPRYVSDLEFDPSVIAPSDDLDAVVRDAEVVILATPSAYLKDFLSPLTVSLKDKFIVSAIKGIVPGDYQTVVESLLPAAGTLHGPLARRRGLARETLLPDGGLHRSGECPPDRLSLCRRKHPPELFDRPLWH